MTRPDAPRLRIDHATVFDGHDLGRTEGSITIAGGEIVDIGAAGPADVVLDARGRTVVPGLIDAHFHAYGISLDMTVIESGTPSYLALAGARRLRAALRRGFTTVRDVAGGDPGLARAVDEGLLSAPRYLYTGPALSQTGGHGDPRHAETVCGCSQAFMTEVVDGLDALRQAVRERFRRGAHAIKLMTSGGVVSPTDPLRIPQYSADEVRAVCEEASRRGSYVAAHAYSPEAIVHSVENGVRTIEHGNLLDAPTARLMAAHGAALVPTLATYDAMARRGAELGLHEAGLRKNLEVLDAGRDAIRYAREAGVRVGFGTDLMGELEDEQLQGLRLQVEADGVLGTLRSVTATNADILGRPDLGRIAVGAAADVLVLDGDPFEDPTVLWSAEDRYAVVARGELVVAPPDGAR